MRVSPIYILTFLVHSIIGLWFLLYIYLHFLVIQSLGRGFFYIYLHFCSFNPWVGVSPIYTDISCLFNHWDGVSTTNTYISCS